MRFTKFQGFGNDYLVFEADQLKNVEDLGSFARRICNRHYGAGGDGIAIASCADTDNADFRVRIFNPDGSEAGMSGNGTRCAAAYLFFHGLWSNDLLRLQTRNGIKRYHLLEKSNSGATFSFRSELGQPRFEPASIPMITDQPRGDIIDYPLVVNGQTLPVTALQMGNPNCCVFVDDFETIDWRRLGPLIENHPQFPERTNVIFIRVRGRNRIEERIWERGVGETESSGTCSCAAVVASVINKHCDRKIDVHAPGGVIPIEWRDDDEVVLTGSASAVYSGEWLVN
ncbi:MAG TPA: diaminopimelate epimerase [Pyrinomonadaceae bacterium]|jgi:diaminopimelate epimerase|nr:diaminopimelate epimerase [Pyrinomonadaceae bacterium]